MKLSKSIMKGEKAVVEIENALDALYSTLSEGIHFKYFLTLKSSRMMPPHLFITHDKIEFQVGASDES